MTVTNPTLIDKLRALIADLGETAHGSEKIAGVRKFLKECSKQERVDCLRDLLFQEPIFWEEVKERVWPGNPKNQEDNRFAFLQGDIVETTMVMVPGIAFSGHEHGLWLILTPDCDVVRAEYVSVAAVHEVTADNKDYMARYSYASKLQRWKEFPIPSIPGEQGKSYFADLTKPNFIHKDSRELANPIASLYPEGWHLLNALIQEKETRAVNIDEAVKIRQRSAGAQSAAEE
jgi:hypothetical protein